MTGIEEAQTDKTDAETRLTEALNLKASIEATIGQFSAREKAASEAIIQTQEILAGRAVAGYVRGPTSPVEVYLNGNPNQTSTRGIYLTAVAAEDNVTIDELDAIRGGADQNVIDYSLQLVDVAAEIVAARVAITTSTAAVDALVEEASTVAETVSSLELRLSVLRADPGRIIFPVAGKAWFYDSWGAPRSGGRYHIGVDIITDEGTPLVAIESGTIRVTGHVSLGGWRLWLEGDSGNWYYYAHLYAYAPGIQPGVPVQMGQQIGWAGQTGNARFSVPHLHLEIHPGGRNAAPINPYPIMYSIAGSNQTVGGDTYGREPSTLSS